MESLDEIPVSAIAPTPSQSCSSDKKLFSTLEKLSVSSSCFASLCPNLFRSPHFGSSARIESVVHCISVDRIHFIGIVHEKLRTILGVGSRTAWLGDSTLTPKGQKRPRQKRYVLAGGEGVSPAGFFLLEFAGCFRGQADSCGSKPNA